MELIRHVPSRPLPPYAYVPGVTPHPVTDPQGHAHGRRELEPPHLPAAEWRCNEAYLFGVDLFNAGFFWEAHEAWEGVWKASREADQAQATFVQGLIMIAAAQLKRRLAAPEASATLEGEGLERLRAVYEATGAGYLGVGYMGVTPEAVAEALGDPPRLVLAP